MAKDCPRHHRLPFKPPKGGPSSLQAHAVGISNADIRAAAIEEGITCGLYGMAVCIPELSELDAMKQLVIAERTLASLRTMAVTFPTDEHINPVYDPYGRDRFSLSVHGGPDTFLLSNKHNLDDYIIYYQQLCDPNFDVVVWLTDLKLRNYKDLICIKPAPQQSSPESPDESGLCELPEGPLSGSPGRESTWEPQASYTSSPSDTDLIDSSQGSWEFIPSSPPEVNLDLSNDDPDVPALIDYESSDEDEPIDTRTANNDSDDFEIVSSDSIYCGGALTNLPDICALQRHAARPKSTGRLLPRSLIVVVLVNDRPCRALIDSGSLTDFISTTVVDQLKLKFDLLEKPIPLQLAVLGSRSIVKATTTVDLKYQEISGPRTLDIANLEAYDVILGMPFLFQHQVLLGFNIRKNPWAI